MQKKSKKNEGGEKKSNSGEVVQKKEGGEKKNDGNLTVVLKSDFHCEGCVTKVVKAIKSVGGITIMAYSFEYFYRNICKLLLLLLFYLVVLLFPCFCILS